jgi:hypothetical protein
VTFDQLALPADVNRPARDQARHLSFGRFLIALAPTSTADIDRHVADALLIAGPTHGRCRRVSERGCLTDRTG